MESLHRLGKSMPNLSEICHPLRPLLKKNTKFFWTDDQEQHFKLIKTKIAEATRQRKINRSGNPDLENRIKCDASRKGLGCALEQRIPNGWHTVAFASRFYIQLEIDIALKSLNYWASFVPLNISNITLMESPTLS